MNVLHINTTDKAGGAARAALRLHDAMRNAGINSKYLVLTKTINGSPDIITVSLYEQYVRRIMNTIHEKIETTSMKNIPYRFSTFNYGIDISNRPEVKEVDVIYLHWINSSFISGKTLEKILRKGKRVFWFMHDMFPITGGCHHSFECLNYQTECRKCPYHTKKHLLQDIALSQFKKKQRLYKKYNNLTFIAPSNWLFESAKKSEVIQNNNIHHIPNMIDTVLFKEIDKDAARQLFCIDSKKKIIGFGAENVLAAPYKGWAYFQDALNVLLNNNPTLVADIEILVFGSSYNKKLADSLPFKAHFLGHLSDEYSLVMAYNCMDVFVIPSLAENFPQTILESLAVNVPVVGFNIGGIPDMVNQNTGYLARYKDSEDLANGIAFILQNGRYNVRGYIEPFSANKILERHKLLWIQYCK
jgi:glycosyltransferase involved in cell wall biosynthesis